MPPRLLDRFLTCAALTRAVGPCVPVADPELLRAGTEAVPLVHKRSKYLDIHADLRLHGHHHARDVGVAVDGIAVIGLRKVEVLRLRAENLL